MKEAGSPYWKSVRCFGIGNMECALLSQPARYRLLDTDLGKSLGYRTKKRPPNHSTALSKPQHHIIDPTNPNSALNNGVEHRLHVCRRAADDAQHLGRCRLVVPGLTPLCGALVGLGV